MRVYSCVCVCCALSASLLAAPLSAWARPRPRQARRGFSLRSQLRQLRHVADPRPFAVVCVFIAQQLMKQIQTNSIYTRTYNIQLHVQQHCAYIKTYIKLTYKFASRHFTFDSSKKNQIQRKLDKQQMNFVSNKQQQQQQQIVQLCKVFRKERK